MEKYSGLRFNSQFPFCSFPFVLDTYSGCNHHCTYCFSYFNSLVHCATREKEVKFGFEKEVKVFDIKEIKTVFLEPKNIQQKLLHGAIKQRLPIHWGGVTDPFSHYEKQYGVSLEIAKFLAAQQYPYIVSTKGSIVLQPAYKKALADGLNIIQISLISTDKSLNKIELDSSIKDRLEAIEYYASIGKKVVVRCQPYIPKYCRQHYEKLVKEVAKRGAKAITVEFLKLTTYLTPQVKQAYQRLNAGVGFNIVNYYRLYGKKTGSDIELKSGEKANDIYNCRKIAHENGLEFYVADNAFRFIGDSPICCGLKGDEKGFEGHRKCTTSFGLFKAKKEGYLYWEDICDEKDCLQNCPFNSNFLNRQNVKYALETKNWSFRDYLRGFWNNPRCSVNPSKFFENLKVAGKDKNGNLFYKWVEQFPR
jgi:DNA repair photolyase